MAQKVVVQLLDDVGGETADQTVEFALDGVAYEIDLTDARAAEFRAALEPWAGSARRTGGRRNTSRGGARRTAASRGDLAQIRTWARENGYTVSDRGRISQEIQDAYDARASESSATEGEQD